MTQSASHRKYSFRKLAEYALEQNERFNDVEAGQKIAQLLLQKSVNINHVDNSGKTPLDSAVFYGKSSSTFLVTNFV